MKATISYKGQNILKEIVVANTFWLRLSGYQFRPRPHVDGFLFEPANSIHTFWCFFPLDLVFLSKDNKVLKVVRGIKPWRMTRIYKNSARVIEVPAGHVPAQLNEGDVVEVINV